MAVTKRLRYEILRRDNHACRYCGASAPDVKLTVDHVTPTALGGTDEPSNLVAACRDCNAGKSSASVDASLVEDVRQDALRHAELMRQAYSVLVDRTKDRDDYVAEFEYAYDDLLPDGWAGTLGRWFDMGVPLELLLDAITRTRRQRRVALRNRFSYLCGIVWNQVHVVTECATEKAAIEGAFMTEGSLFDERFDNYQLGVRVGEKRGDPVVRMLSDLVDHMPVKPDPWGDF